MSITGECLRCTRPYIVNLATHYDTGFCSLRCEEAATAEREEMGASEDRRLDEDRSAEAYGGTK